MNRWVILPGVFLVGGMLLVVVGMIWPHAISSETVWKEEQAQELSRSGAELHRLQYEYHTALEPREARPSRPGLRVAHEHGGQHKDVAQLQAQLDEARGNYERSRAQLESARGWRFTTGTILTWIGVVVCVCGVAGYFVLKMPWAQQFVED